jgi:5'-nucleotidase
MRVARVLAVPTLAAAVVALLPVASTRPAQAAPWTPLSPVSVTFPDQASPDHDRGHATAKGHLIAFNDFHGNIDPPVGSGGLVNGNPAGGVEYLATAVKRLRAEANKQTRNVYTVAAGDLVGASPLVSAAFHDEPAIEEMNALGLQLSSVGNHEYDEGVDELKRLQRGGCHPKDGCQDGDGFAGASFRYLAANVVEKSTGLPSMLPLDVKLVDGVPVGFVGMTLQGTPSIVNPAGIQTVEFKNEVETANRYADLLGRYLACTRWCCSSTRAAASRPRRRRSPTCPAAPTSPVTSPGSSRACAPSTGSWSPGTRTASTVARCPTRRAQLGRDQRRIVRHVGHRPVVHARQAHHRFATATARNDIVFNGVPDGNGGWKKDAAGNFLRNPDTVDAPAKSDRRQVPAAVAPLANKVVGSITADIPSTANAAGESPLGDVIADGMLKYTTAASAQLAVMNPGGIRAPLSFANSPGGEAPGQVTYGECFTVQPFNNLV